MKRCSCQLDNLVLPSGATAVCVITDYKIVPQKDYSVTRYFKRCRIVFKSGVRTGQRVTLCYTLSNSREIVTHVCDHR